MLTEAKVAELFTKAFMVVFCPVLFLEGQKTRGRGGDELRDIQIAPPLNSLQSVTGASKLLKYKNSSTNCNA